jgi:hypothetical protein
MTRSNPSQCRVPITWLRVFLGLLLIVFLTALTQIGGLLFLLVWVVHERSDRLPTWLTTLVFLLLYSFSTFLVVPRIAPLFGRVPLPSSVDGIIAPRTFLTAFLNRHYVRPELLDVLNSVATEYTKGSTGRQILYLDACFPFGNGFPLLPHLSHNDGNKVDLAFAYNHLDGSPAQGETPSPIGYGEFALPTIDEEHTADRCVQQGYWWYTIMDFVPVDPALMLDEKRTRQLIELFAAHPRTGKVFVEPFLKARWGISNPKVRFHGCHAVSHADHIHVQL